MRMRTCLLGAPVMLLGILLGAALPGYAQRSAAPATTPATYVGLTTTNTYTPLPTTAPGPTTQGGPTTMTTTYPAVGVVPIDDALRRGYRINAFYKKTLTINGIVVMGSEKVSDYAFLEAAYMLDHQLHDSPKWVKDALVTSKIWLSIIADVEYTMDLPENQNPRNNAPIEAAFQDRRSRGLGGMPWCSCAEENLLNLRGDPYGGNGSQGSGENITIHEFSHTVASAIQRVRPEWYQRLRQVYNDALKPGNRLEVFDHNRPNNPVYAATNEQEYWAEGAQAWFDNANPGNSGGIATRDQVKAKDPELAALLTEIYGDGKWKYLKTTAKKPDGTTLRPKEDLVHLAGLDALRNKFPVFDFNKSPRIVAAAKAAATAAAQNAATQPAATAPAKGP